MFFRYELHSVLAIECSGESAHMRRFTKGVCCLHTQIMNADEELGQFVELHSCWRSQSGRKAILEPCL